MLTIDQAFAQLSDYATEQWAALGRSAPARLRKPLNDCLHDRLAEPVVAPMDVPPFDNSAMDGFALQRSSLNDNTKTPTGWTLPIAGRVAAGDTPTTLTPGTAIQIFTGAPMPVGADAVVIQENCTVDPITQTVTLTERPNQNAHIRPRGQDIAEGSSVLPAGHRLSPQDLGLCAALGLSELTVFKPVRVALLSTGNELVAPGAPLGAGKRYDSNTAMLRGMLQQLGAEVVLSCNVPDDLLETQQALQNAAEQADLILCSGGVSVGEADYVKAAVHAVGQLDFWKIAMKPGKPLAVGTVGTAFFMGLPGNPVSAFVTAHLFLPLFLEAIHGANGCRPPSFFVPCPVNVTEKNTRAQWLRVRLLPTGMEFFDNHSSGVLRSVSWGNALCLIPANTAIQAGELVEVFPYGGEFFGGFC